MDLERLREAKAKKGYSMAKIAELAHIPLRTVENIFGGVVKNPYAGTVSAIESVLGISENGTVILNEKEKRLVVAFDSLTPIMQDTVLDMVESAARTQQSKTKRSII